jgi:hypothetical protein
MKMKTSVNQRRLSIEALENRVVFASDLGIVDAGSMHPQGDGLWHQNEVAASCSGQGDPSPTIVKSSDEILARRWNGTKPAGFRTILASLGSGSEDRREVSWFADRSTDFFSEPFQPIAAPDPIEEPAAHSWPLVFGFAHASSPFAADVGESGRSSIDRATVLEIVANSERAEQPIAKPEANYPNGWKATSILAAALTAAFYRKKSQEELAPLILAGIRRLRPPSSRR